jgi:hypothetical protein
MVQSGKEQEKQIIAPAEKELARPARRFEGIAGGGPKKGHHHQQGNYKYFR